MEMFKSLRAACIGGAKSVCTIYSDFRNSTNEQKNFCGSAKIRLKHSYVSMLLLNRLVVSRM